MVLEEFPEDFGGLRGLSGGFHRASGSFKTVQEGFSGVAEVSRLKCGILRRSRRFVGVLCRFERSF